MVSVAVVYVLAMLLCDRLMGGWENGALIFLATLSGLLVVALFQFPAYDMYFDDEKKGEYYKKEAGYLKRGEGNWLVRTLHGCFR